MSEKKSLKRLKLGSILTDMFPQSIVKIIKFFLWLLLLTGSLCQSYTAIGQEYITSVKHLTSEDGLNGQIKYTGLIDHNGFLWLSSNYGIDRYDGTEVLNIPKPKGLSKEVQILDLFESYEGELFVIMGNQKGNFTDMFSLSDIHCFRIDTKNGTLIDWNVFLKEKAPFEEIEVWRYRITPNGLYVILKNGDLWSLKKKFKKLRRLENLENFHYSNWAIHSDGSLLIGIGNKLIKQDEHGNITLQKDFNDGIAGIIEDPEGGYQLITLSDISFSGHYLDTDFKVKKSFDLFNWQLPIKEKTVDGNYLEKVDGSVKLIDKNGGTILDLAGIIGIDNQKNSITSSQWVYQSPVSNTIVVQGHENPVIINLTKTPFSNYFIDQKKQFGIRGIAVADNGDIMAGSGAYCYLFNKKGLKQKIQNPWIEKHPMIQSQINYFDSLEQTFIAMSHGHIFEYVPSDNKAIAYPRALMAHTKGAIAHKAFKHPLLFSDKGFNELNQDCSCINKFLVADQSHPINQSEIHKVQFHGNKAFIITDESIYTWDFKQNKIVAQSAFPKEITQVKILDVYFDNYENIWLATEGSGVYHWNIKSNKLVNYNGEKGLSRDVVYAIKRDTFGRFWLPTTYGLNCLDPETGVIRNYLTNDGIPNNEFNTHSFHQDKNGHLYFGGLNGFTTFDPNSIVDTEKPSPKTLITTVNLYDIESGGKTSINFDEINPIVFHNGKEILEVNFSTIDIHIPSAPKFQYKFEETGEPWQNYSSTSLSFTNLNPGEYTLKIRGQDGQNSWSIEEASLHISVPTPFFKSQFFWILLIAFLLIAAILFSNWRNATLRRNQIKFTQEVEKRTLSLQKSKDLIERQASELAQVDKVKSRFFTNLSHELRTPLTLILNPLKNLKKLTFDNPKLNEDVDNAMAASIQLKTLVGRVLRISEVDADSLVLKEMDVSIIHFIKNVIDPFRETAIDLGIEFEVEAGASKNKMISIDFEKLKEIAESLISNALKFCREGDRIKVGLVAENDLLTLSCQDTGIGIPLDQQEKIFTNYYQSTDINQPAMGGLGLGLPMAKSFATIMNGYLVVHSQPGKGATFTLTVPCTILKKEAGPLAATENTSGKATAEQDLNRSTTSIAKDQASILLVEDHKLMNKLISNILQPHYNIVSASNGKKALELLSRKNGRSIPVDLIISDWMMPQMDGPTFLEALKQKDKNIPVIMLTARASQADKLSMLKIGVDDYMTKPFDPEELKVRVLNLLHNKRERHQALVDDGLKTPQPQFAIEPTVNEKWLQQLESEVTNNLGEANYSIVDLAKSMNLGERQLNRKIKSLTGLTPGNYIRECRLLKARHLLEHHQMHTVSEVCFAVGFSTQEYFSKKFFERFGKLPSSYLS